MKYAMTLKWNGTICLEGKMSATMAWTILRAASGDFPSPVKAGWLQPSLNDLIEAKRGTAFVCRAEDPKVVGICHYSLIAIE